MSTCSTVVGSIPKNGGSNNGISLKSPVERLEVSLKMEVVTTGRRYGVRGYCWKNPKNGGSNNLQSQPMSRTKLEVTLETVAVTTAASNVKNNS